VRAAPQRFWRKRGRWAHIGRSAHSSTSPTPFAALPRPSRIRIASPRVLHHSHTIRYSLGRGRQPTRSPQPVARRHQVLPTPPNDAITHAARTQHLRHSRRHFLPSHHLFQPQSPLLVDQQTRAENRPPAPGFLLCSRDHTFPLLRRGGRANARKGKAARGQAEQGDGVGDEEIARRRSILTSLTTKTD
jgi:hypothetical protein